MTPKEKAKELIKKMKFATDEFGYININMERHKQCALIAVNEICRAVEFLDDETEDFWLDVKIEIEKL